MLESTKNKIKEYYDEMMSLFKKDRLSSQECTRIEILGRCIRKQVESTGKHSINVLTGKINIDWTVAPYWANWAAMYSDGNWAWFRTMPYLAMEWRTMGGQREFFDGPKYPIGKWMESLVSRS